MTFPHSTADNDLSRSAGREERTSCHDLCNRGRSRGQSQGLLKRWLCELTLILLQRDREAEAARHEVDSTQRLLRRCLQPQGGAVLARRGGAVQPLVERLQAAYTDIWQLRFLQGLEKLKASPLCALRLVTRVWSLTPSLETWQLQIACRVDARYSLWPARLTG